FSAPSPLHGPEGGPAALARDLLKGIANRGLYPYHLIIGATIWALKWLGLRVRHAPENMYRRRRDGRPFRTSLRLPARRARPLSTKLKRPGPLDLERNRETPPPPA